MKDRPSRKPSRITARELLVEVFLEPREEHALHSVRTWAKVKGGIQILCTCGGLATTPMTEGVDEKDDPKLLALQNMPRLPPRAFDDMTAGAWKK
jgi:hypothetical protein